MNISYNWLKDLINIELSAEETAAALTRVGLAVEGIHPHGDDLVFDIDLTSNRPDCLSHFGVARELRVITGKEFPAETQNRGEEVDPIDAVPIPSILAPDFVKIEAPELCNRFTARIVKNVKIGPSPQWLVDRLEAVGERSINNVADITNYVMLELGQPMHAFDLDKLAEKRIVVRTAKTGESLRTLDEVERKFDESMLMICDAEKPVAVGGVMGGLDSSITEQTTNVLIEVAYFDRASIRQTSRKLGLATEASYRFERGVDIENLKRASNRAAELIVELGGGELGEFIDVYPKRAVPVQVESSNISAAVKRLTGLDVTTEECIRILDALGIAGTDNGSSRTFVSPTWRHDIAIEEDLVEEIARHTGYENIADELPPSYGAGEYQASEARKKLLRLKLTDIGFDEAISYSFVDTKFDDDFDIVHGLINEKIDDKLITLQDSVIEGAVRMRPTILPGLIEAVRFNLNHQRRDLKLFEIGKVFAASGSEDGLPTERELLSIAITGGEMLQKHVESTRALDFYDAKGAVEAALDAVGFPSPEFRAEDVKHLRPGLAAGIYIDGGNIGTIGRLSESIATRYKFRNPVFVAEIDLDAVLSRNTSPVLYYPLPKYPSIVRDVSFLVGRDTTFDDVRSVVIDHGADICRNLGFVDIFEGKGVEDGKRSLTVRLEYRNDERTLVDEEVAAVHTQILESLSSTLGIEPRS